jgi:hypothetical protein
LPHDNLLAIEVEVLDPKLEAFLESQTRPTYASSVRRL